MTARMLKKRIISFEQAELDGKPDGTPSPIRMVEVLGYFGAVTLFVATLALMVEVAVDDDFLFGGIDNIPGGLVVLAGSLILFALGHRLTANDQGAARRTGGFTLAAGFGLWAIAVNLLLLELDAGDFTPVLVAAPVVAAAWWAYQRFQSVPTQLALFAAAVQAMNALLVLIQVVEYADPQEQAIGVAISGSAPEMPWLALVFQCALGIGWLWFTNQGVLHPRNTGFALGSLYAGLQGVSLFGTDDGWVILFAAVTAVVVYGGVTSRSSVLLGIGAAGLAVFILMVFSILVDEVTPVSVALWFGIPGVAAAAYSLFRLTQLEAESVEE